MKKFKDYWEHIKPSSQVKSRFIKITNPTIEMTIDKDGIEARVEFLFVDLELTAFANVEHFEQEGSDVNIPEKAKFKRIIQGPSQSVYVRAARVASRIGLSEERSFNHRWNRTLLNLLNKPSENKTMINLGIYKPKEHFGLYNIKPPAELLSQKLIDSKIPGARLANLAGVEESTLYRHLKGNKDAKGMDISRDAAIKYSRVLGCDPSELLFNPLQIPVWGEVDTLVWKGSGKYPVYAGEIIGYSKEKYTLCPREIYRPDVKSVRINSESSFYHNHVAFYYNSNEPVVFENQLVIVGVRLKNSDNNEIRFRYFFGIYRQNKNNKTVDILNPDPDAHDITLYEQDEDCNTWEDLKSLYESNNRYVIEDIKPEFVAPVAALVNHGEIKEKENLIRDHNKFYNEARTTDLFSKNESKKFLLRQFIINQEKERIRDEINAGSYKYDLSDTEINQRSEKKAEDIFTRINDLFYVDVLKNINKKLRPDVSIKTDKGIKNFEIKTRDGIKAVREDFSEEEINRINQIDDEINDLANYQPDPEEKKAV